MPNIGTLLKAEITRLSRREIRKELSAVKKATVSSRHHIVALKRQVAALEQKAGQLERRTVQASSVPTTSTSRTNVALNLEKWSMSPL